MVSPIPAAPNLSLRPPAPPPDAAAGPPPADPAALPDHGAALLPGLRVDAYSLDLPVGDGQLGDRASHGAFDAILAGWRRRLRGGGGHDPFGPDPEAEVPRAALDEALAGGSPEAAGLVQGAVEDFARELVAVVRRFLRLPEWQGTQRIVVGGGFRSARVGEIAVGRAAVLLRAAGEDLALTPIRHDPDEAGLIGAARLLPAALVAPHDAVLAADLGGTCFRGGVVLPRLGLARDGAQAAVWRSAIWRHAGERVDRAGALQRLAGLLAELAAEARAAGLSLAPAVAIGLPGRVEADGRISGGTQNLPGDWEAEHVRIAPALARLLPRLGSEAPSVVLHNDAVAQGLSEAPFQRGVARWGVLTIGTGLGNARFTNLPRGGVGRLSAWRPAPWHRPRRPSGRSSAPPPARRGG